MRQYSVYTGRGSQCSSIFCRILTSAQDGLLHPVAVVEVEAAVVAAREQRRGRGSVGRGTHGYARDPVWVERLVARLRRREELNILQRNRHLTRQATLDDRLGKRAAQQLAVEQEVEGPRL